MSNEREPLTVLHLVGAAIIVWVVYQSTEPKPAQPEPEPPGISTGMLSDVRLTLDPATHAAAVEFIRTGKIASGRFGIDATAVRSIECLPGRLVFSPPVRLRWDGPGPLRAGTTIKEIRLADSGAIVVDVVNSPIDLQIEAKQ